MGEAGTVGNGTDGLGRAFRMGAGTPIHPKITESPGAETTEKRWKGPSRAPPGAPE